MSKTNPPAATVADPTLPADETYLRDEGFSCEECGWTAESCECGDEDVDALADTQRPGRAAEWTTDADVLGAADSGELFRVDGAEAFLLSRTDVVHLLGRVERGEERAVYCHDWILVRASSAVDALVTSRSFDASPIVLDGVVAVVAS